MPTRLNSRSLINVLPNLQPPSEVFRLGDIFDEATRGHYQSGATKRFANPKPLDDTLPLDFRLLEIDQKTDGPAGDSQIVETLRSVLVGEPIYTFQLDDQHVFDEFRVRLLVELREVRSLETVRDLVGAPIGGTCRWSGGLVSGGDAINPSAMRLEIQDNVADDAADKVE